MTTYRLFIKNIKELVLVCKNHEKMLIGKAMDNVETIKNASIIVDNNGRIFDLGDASEMEKKYESATFETIIDATDKIVLPGFIDAHTHPVFSGDRCHEFAMKVRGATYMEIHEAGGGIHFTVDHTKQSSEEELYKLFESRLKRMIAQGTTCVECKSGYGLDTENEIKMLRVITKAAREHKIGIVSTFLGAHSVPKGKTPEEGYKAIIEDMIPKIAQLRDQGELQVDFIDGFCESGVYDVEKMQGILEKGKEYGMKLCFHADELSPLHGAEMGAKLGVINMSHLEEITDQGIEDMAIYILRVSPPPARKMIEKNVPVAIASDYNPNAHCLSMPYIMSCACVSLRLTLNEALVAATINAAAAIDVSDQYGSIEIGKHGDFVLLDAPDWQHIIYEFADPQIEAVFKDGELIYKQQSAVSF
ncbi:hypothetical protein WA158_002404 [Blastocystis sp. Blastoise]